MPFLFHFIDRVEPFDEVIWGQTHCILVSAGKENLIVPYDGIEHKHANASGWDIDPMPRLLMRGQA